MTHHSQPTVQLGGAEDPIVMPQLGAGFWEVPPETTAELVEEALRLGYRSLDTAAAYQNETGVGEGFAAAGLPREDVFITTKVWNSDHGYDKTLRAFEDSLARLGIEYVDLYLIHWPTPQRDRYVDTWRALRTLRQDGSARAIGTCNFNVEHLQRLYDEFGEYPSLNQVELHPYLSQPELRAFHAEHGIVTEDWSPLAARLDLIADPVVTTIAAETGATPAQVVYRWHLDLGHVVIPRSTKAERLAENLATLDVTLSPEQFDALTALDRGARTGPDPATFELA